MPSPDAEALIEVYMQYRMPVEAPSRSAGELRAMSAQMAEAQPPVAGTGVDIDAVDLGGVPAERTRPSAARAARVVVYVHGGGYVCGSAGGQRAFLAELARAADAEVLAVEYRLAPEHAHPAAVDDVVAAYVAARELAGDRPVVVGGDSAGGGLAVGAVVAMRERGIALPSAVFALSPWADLTLTGEALLSHAARDVMVRVNDLEMMRSAYLVGGDPNIATASPALADLAGLPPLRVQVGSEEILVGDAHLLVRRAKEAGVAAELEVADGMFHTFQVLAPHLPESRDAIASLVRFVTAA